jgi:hypothetical protein
MRLAEALVSAPSKDLDELAVRLIHPEGELPKPLVCNTLDGIIRNFRYVQDFLFDRQPPAFSILSALLEADHYALSEDVLRDAVDARTRRICQLISDGSILHRADSLRLYRRVLYEARRNGIDIDASESAILGVLRRELGILHVEHFLIEHHSDLHEFWRADDAFDREMRELRSGGLLFSSDAGVALPEDLVPLVFQALGMDMTPACSGRLFSRLSVTELADALAIVEAKTSGTKEERAERLLMHMVPPRAILRLVSLDTLRTICRDASKATSGSKEELVERIVALFAAGLDEAEPEAPAPEPVREQRSLNEQRFHALFCSLRGGELTDILEEFPDLRKSGVKEVRAATLWASPSSEATLLLKLSNRQLEDILVRLRLKISGSKHERVERIIQNFATTDLDSLPQAVDENSSDAHATDRTESSSETD